MHVTRRKAEKILQRPKSCVQYVPAVPPPAKPMPMWVKSGLRMLARWPGLFIQPRTTSAGSAGRRRCSPRWCGARSPRRRPGPTAGCRRGGVGVEGAGDHVVAVRLGRGGEQGVDGERRQALRGPLGIGQRDHLTRRLPQAVVAEGPGPQRRPVHVAGASAGDVREPRLAVRRVVQRVAGLLGGEAVLHELARGAGPETRCSPTVRYAYPADVMRW